MVNRIYGVLYRNIKFIYYKILYGKRLKIGHKIIVRDKFRINLSKNAVLHIGNNVFFNHDCSINVHKEIFIGNQCIFGENVKLYDHNHVFKHLNIPYALQGFSDEKIVIEDGCWIGSNVVILKGVHIGKQCVIGAGCTVKENIPHASILISHKNYNIIPHFESQET